MHTYLYFMLAFYWSLTLLTLSGLGVKNKTALFVHPHSQPEWNEHLKAYHTFISRMCCVSYMACLISEIYTDLHHLYRASRFKLHWSRHARPMLMCPLSPHCTPPLTSLLKPAISVSDMLIWAVHEVINLCLKLCGRIFNIPS